MGKFSRALDWVVDAALPAALMAAIGAVWLAATGLLFYAAWWAGLICLIVGLPFVLALWQDRSDRRLV